MILFTKQISPSIYKYFIWNTLNDGLSVVIIYFSIALVYILITNDRPPLSVFQINNVYAGC